MVVLLTCKNEEDRSKIEAQECSRARADNPGVGDSIWPKFELIQAFMSSLPARMRMIDSKMKELECSQDFSHYKSMGIFPDAQGQLTLQSLVRSGQISNLSEML